MSPSQTMSQDPSPFDNMQELWERRRAATGARGNTGMTALPGGGPRSAALDSAAVALPSDGPESIATATPVPAPVPARAPGPGPALASAPAVPAPALAPAPAPPALAPTAPAPAAGDDHHDCGLGKWFLDVGGSFVGFILMCTGSDDVDED